MLSIAKVGKTLCVHVVCLVFAGRMMVDGYTACEDGTTDADSKMRAINEAFGRSNVTDIVFLLDRSKSISERAFDNTKETIRTLMDYLMLRRVIYLHKDYARVAVVSFGVQGMVEFDGISSESNTVHACNFDDLVARITPGTQGRNASNMIRAFDVGIFNFIWLIT